MRKKKHKELLTMPRAINKLTVKNGLFGQPSVCTACTRHDNDGNLSDNTNYTMANVICFFTFHKKSHHTLSII